MFGFGRGPAYESGFNFVIDRLALGPPSGEFVRPPSRFAIGTPTTSATGRWAVVAKDPTSYGMARMAEMTVDAFGVEQAVFRDIERAQAWLLREEARKTG
jgi:hypothetical protein